MIATYNQVKTEMRTKEAEFTRELQRSQFAQSRTIGFLAKFVGRGQARAAKRVNNR